MSDSERSYISSYSVSSSAESFGNNEGITGMYECERVSRSEKKQRKSSSSTLPQKYSYKNVNKLLKLH